MAGGRVSNRAEAAYADEQHGAPDDTEYGVQPHEQQVQHGTMQQPATLPLHEVEARRKLDMNDPEMGGLYNDKDIFKFYSRSADSIPGKGKAGAGETLSDDSDFSELAGIRDWRKVLSNFHTRNDADGDILALFTSRSEEGETLNWASVEHWYHAHKFKKNNPDYFKLFSMDSKSEIATDPRKALGAGGRTGFITVDKKRKKFRDDSIKMDSDFFSNGNNEIIMEAGQRLKFTQDEHSKKVLLATKEAKLVHLETRRGQATKLVPFINTMKIRKELNGQ